MGPTHKTFEEMAAAIFAVDDADPNFPGIVPYDNPAMLTVGYIKAAARSKRTHKDQWSCPIEDIKGTPVAPETKARLQELVERGRTSHEQ
jgi:hypothetical protein